ncbi:MAG: glutamate formimidoyltransferase [Bacteroidetes bacterium]|nr:glutamate formimidoyltransferase [Bacteroidota bacterium]
MEKIIECIPNFSEGQNLSIINAIADKIRSVKDSLLLNVDSGYDANRTVYTFAGPPEAVLEAAFLAIKAAVELIDMRFQKGEHPRIGACDVCPLVPLKGVTMDEVIQYSKELSAKVANELNVPVYLYENSQPKHYRSNLSIIRKGEYEGLKEKMLLPEWKPDFGGTAFNEKSGATVIGARDFLIAYNVNLNTKSEKIANEIAGEIREIGVIKRNKFTHEIERDSNGTPLRIPGSLKYVKAIGWYMEHFNKAQVSFNLINFRKTPIHIVYEETKKKAREKGFDVTGSELIALIPLDALLMAGRFYATQQNFSENDFSERKLVEIAVDKLGLAELEPFIIEVRIIEYALKHSKIND